MTIIKTFQNLYFSKYESASKGCLVNFDVDTSFKTSFSNNDTKLFFVILDSRNYWNMNHQKLFLEQKIGKENLKEEQVSNNNTKRPFGITDFVYIYNQKDWQQ